MKSIKRTGIISVLVVTALFISFTTSCTSYHKNRLYLQITCPKGQKCQKLDPTTISFFKEDFRCIGVITHSTTDSKHAYYSLLIKLKPKAAKKFYALTSRNRGNILTLSYNDKLAQSAIIQSAMGSDFQLSSLTEKQANTIKNGFKAPNCQQ